MTPDIKNIVCFCILMQNDKGILGKSSDYILEKFRNLIEIESDNPESLLDHENQGILADWEELWLN